MARRTLEALDSSTGFGSSNSARRAGGIAGGALSGEYPSPGPGLPPLVGMAISEDFARGVADWSQSILGSPGPGGAVAAVAPDGWNEHGIVQIATGGGSANVGYLYTYGSVASFYRIPPPGSVWACKLRLTTGTSAYELWAGFASAAARVADADSTQFVGIRSVGGTVRGIAKDGATSETSTDLGYDCESSTWRVFGFKVAGTTAAPSLQWFVGDEHDSNRMVFDIEHIGAAVTTTLPSTALLPVFGLVTTDTADKVAQFDFWSLGGRVARG
jgi:hypothetical protein